MARKPTVSITDDVNKLLSRFAREHGCTKSKAVALLITPECVRAFNKSEYNSNRHKLRRTPNKKNHITLVPTASKVD